MRAAAGFGLALAFLCGLANAQQLPDNKNVVREVAGTILWRTLSTGEIRGQERFQITVHPDGSRTLMTASRYGPRDMLRHSLYRIDAALRPQEAWLQYWIDGDWRASGHLSVDGPKMSVVSRSPSGTAEHMVDIPGAFAILPHQLTPDSLRVMLLDPERNSPQEITVYDPDPLAAGEGGLLGKIATQTISYVGDKDVTVPAGTFLARHYRIEDAIDLYTTGPDAVVVKWRFQALDREHVLTDLKTYR